MPNPAFASYNRPSALTHHQSLGGSFDALELTVRWGGGRPNQGRGSLDFAPKRYAGLGGGSRHRVDGASALSPQFLPQDHGIGKRSSLLFS